MPASQHVSEGYEAIKICEAQRLKTNRVLVIFLLCSCNNSHTSPHSTGYIALLLVVAWDEWKGYTNSIFECMSFWCAVNSHFIIGQPAKLRMEYEFFCFTHCRNNINTITVQKMLPNTTLFVHVCKIFHASFYFISNLYGYFRFYSRSPPPEQERIRDVSSRKYENFLLRVYFLLYC